MSDLISRQAAIDAIKENMPDELAATASDLKIGYTCGMAQACVVLKGMPSAQPEAYDSQKEVAKYVTAYSDGYDRGEADAQPEQRWIPCSLRHQCYIPELKDCKNEPYLVTYETVTGRRYVRKTNIYNGRVQSKENRVVAYMPLPEPWRGEEP